MVVRLPLLLVVALALAGCQDSGGPQPTLLEAGTPDEGEPPSSASNATDLDPVVSWAWYNASASAAHGLSGYVESGFNHSGVARIDLSSDPTMTGLVAELRWGDALQDLELIVAVPPPGRCVEFPPQADPGCYTSIPGDWLDTGDDGHYEAPHTPGTPPVARIELGADKLALYGTPQWAIFGWVRTAAVDVRMVLAVSAFHGGDIPDGYTAFPDGHTAG